MDVVASEALVACQLLSLSPALVFMEGAFGEPPSVEALHAQLLARRAATPPGVARVLHLLPRATGAPVSDGREAAPAAASASGDGPAAAHGGAGAAVPGRAPLAAAADIGWLDNAEWSIRMERQQVPAGAPPSGLPPADALLSTLQASSYAEEHLDPAACQLRHELPVGFIGVWPDLAALGHSCEPNTAFAVLPGGHGYLHAARDVDAGGALTTNKIGRCAAAGVRCAPAARQGRMWRRGGVARMGPLQRCRRAPLCAHAPGAPIGRAPAHAACTVAAARQPSPRPCAAADSLPPPLAAHCAVPCSSRATCGRRRCSS